ncbi:MAG: hypothetical protein AAGE01_13185 [Pseudomonadota bacterium]
MKPRVWTWALAALALAGVSVAEDSAPIRVNLDLGMPLVRSAGGVADARLLDVNVVVFDPGLDAPIPQATEVFPKLRRLEAQYLAHALRNTLAESAQWGAVRTMPEPATGAELEVYGQLLVSDGRDFAVAIGATDASGRRWLDAVYTARATAGRYAFPIEEDPFQPLINKIANDLLAARQQLTERDLARVVELASLRYAEALLPSVFSEYLTTGDDGLIVPLRLPSRDDPTVARVERIREREYLFTDTLDTGYGVLFEDLRVNYTLWRKYSYEEIVGLERYRASASRRRDDGSLNSMMRRYGDFRELKLQKSSLREAAETLETDIEPTAVEVEGRVLELDGSLDERYVEWRRLLAELAAAEQGLPPESP